MYLHDEYVSVSHVKADADRRAALVAAMADNVLDRWHRADAKTRRYGAAWYNDARALADSLGFGRLVGSAVVAILSPRRSWADNVALALAVGRGEAVATMGDQVRKLARLSDGEHPDEVVGGRKVRSFWQNIADASSDAVTCDVWALRAALDGPIGSDDGPAVRRLFGTDFGYGMVADAYRMAAASVGVAPHVMQATVWIVERGSHD